MGNTCVTGRPALDHTPDPNAILEKSLEELNEIAQRNNVPKYAQHRIVPVGNEQKQTSAKSPINI